MKRKLIIIAMILALAVGVSLSFLDTPVAAVAEESYEVDGWRTDIGFDAGDESKFRLYTEFGRAPWLMDGKIYFWTLAEQKAIYKVRKYDDVDVSVDISTINESGKFDSGIYVHANNIWGDIDNLDGWNVNLERGADKTTYYLKLHHFEEGSYVGSVAEVSGLRLPMNTVHLRVVVKSGMLHAFVNYESTPVLSYEIGSKEGYVGLRNFYSPNYFDNLSIVGEGNEKSSAYDAIIEEASKIDSSNLTADSEQAISDALDAAQNADNQYSLEEAVAALEKAMKEALVKRTAEELSAAIERAEAITDGEKYTQNTWDSLQAVLNICRSVDTTDEELVSYWTYRLELKILLLVTYGG